MTFVQFLDWLSEPSGITIAVGALLSVIMEYWPAYQELSSKMKRLVFAALCMAIPIVGASLSVLFGYATPTWEWLYWPAVLAGMTAFTSGTGTHTLFIDRGKKKTA